MTLKGLCEGDHNKPGYRDSVESMDTRIPVLSVSMTYNFVALTMANAHFYGVEIKKKEEDERCHRSV